MRDIVQTGFFSLDPMNNEIVVIDDWGKLTKEELLQEATVYHDKLEKQEQSIDAIIRFAQQQKKNVIYEKGELYAYMKDNQTYQEWLDWLKSINVSYVAAQEYIRLATEYRTEFIYTGGISKFSRNQMRAIHQSGEGHQILAKLESGEIKPDAIKAEIKAAKDRAEEAEKAKIQAIDAMEQAHREALLAQQQLFTTQSTYHAQIAEYTRQIEALKQDMADIVKPEVEIIVLLTTRAALPLTLMKARMMPVCLDECPLLIWVECFLDDGVAYLPRALCDGNAASVDGVLRCAPWYAVLIGELPERYQAAR